MEQLSIFDLDEELVTETLPKQEKENQNTPLSIHLTIALDHPNEVKSKFILGDQVKITLISEELDSETHHYRKYYEPHLIGKVGEVTKLLKKKNGHFSYEVNVYGTVSIFEEEELVWNG